MSNNENTKKERAKVSLVAFLILLILFLVLLIASIIGLGKVYREKANSSASETYKVQFDVNIEDSDIASMRVDKGGLVTRPKDPSKTGYSFEGWYRDEAFSNKWNFETDKITEDTTLYPKWTINTYTVTFDLNEHGARIDSQSVEYNSLINKPADPTTTGYTFGGWYKEITCQNAWNFASDKVTSNVTLFAKWNIDSYAITFDLNGHGTAIDPLTVNFNSLVTAPNIPTADGYTFAGWYKDEELDYKWDFASDKATKATTLYAKWIASYTVSFNMGGEYIVEHYWDLLDTDQIESIKVNHCGLVTKPTDPEDNDGIYIFVNWYRDENCSVEWNFNNDVITKDTTLYAKWAPAICYVNFNMNGIDEDHRPSYQEVAYGSLANAPSYTAPDVDMVSFPYSFEGWYIKQNETIRSWNFETDVVTDHITIYASWIEVK